MDFGETHWTKSRLNVREWLKNYSPSLCGLYESALNMRYSEKFPGKIRFISHAVREIGNSLPDFLSGVKEGENFKYATFLDKNILEKWANAGIDISVQGGMATGQTLPNTIPVPYELMRSFTELMVEHQRATERAARKSWRLFESLRAYKLDFKDDLVPVIKEWDKLRNWFTGFAHEDRGGRASVDIAEFNEKFDQFDRFLQTFSSRFFENLGWIDGALAQATGTPTPKQIDEVIARLVSEQHLMYFFGKLNNPEWVEPLWERGFFKDPLKPVEDKVAKTLSIPFWSQSRYLAAMTPFKPQLVAQIFLGLPKTENFRICEDIMDAVEALPIEEGVKFLPEIKRWIDTKRIIFDSFSLLTDKISSFIVKLATATKHKEALTLLGNLFNVWHERQSKEKYEEERARYLHIEPLTHVEGRNYEELANKYFERFALLEGLDFFKMLCKWLMAAVYASERPSKADGVMVDYSFVWYPVIENRDATHSYHLRNILVHSVREVAETLLKNKIANIKEIVGVLNSRLFPVFKRISLYLMRAYPDEARELIAETLKNEKVFLDYALEREYALLLKDHFSSLTNEDKQQVVNLILKGPVLSEEFLKEHPSEWVEGFKKIWIRDRLSWIEKDLPDQAKEIYEKLLSETGAASPIRDETPTTWMGPTSPKSLDELKALKVGELIDYLKVWKPETGFMVPSAEGLGRYLENIIRENPGEYALNANQFKGLNPTYVRALIGALELALRDKKTFGWKPVLDLCLWVVNQPRGEGKKQREILDSDPHWGWTLNSITRLILAGLGDVQGAIPYSERQTIWKILLPITDDPDPTSEEEKERLEQGSKPVSIAINTTRGNAIHAVFGYTSWVFKNEQAIDKDNSSLDAMPEAKKVLDKHLDISLDPSLAVHSIYGQSLPWLLRLDKKWFIENLQKILPKEKVLGAYWQAAWDGYMFHSPAYDDIFSYLKENYRLAIGKFSKEHTVDHERSEIQKGFIEHLMIYYWRGKLKFGDGGILEEFWTTASIAMKSYALEYMGRSLYNSKEEVPAEIIQRFQALWEKRLEKARENPDQFREELSQFGWWFVCDQLPLEWSVEQLSEVLNTTGRIDPLMYVIDKLEEISDSFPVQTAQCLQKILVATKGGGVYASQEKVRNILRNCLGTAEKQTVEISKNIVNYLGEMGFLDFRDLLEGLN